MHTHRFLPPGFGVRRATSHARRGSASACVPARVSAAPQRCCQRLSGCAGPRVRPPRLAEPGAVQGEEFSESSGPRGSSVRSGQIKAGRVWPQQGPFGAVTASRCPRSHLGRQSSSMMGREARVWLPVPCHPWLTRSAVDGDRKTTEKASAAGSGRRQAPDMSGATGSTPPQGL